MNQNTKSIYEECNNLVSILETKNNELLDLYNDYNMANTVIESALVWYK